MEVRKLAAIDIAFLGTRIIIAEFLLGVVGSAALGIFVALRSHTAFQLALSAYFLSLAVNYVPLLMYALAIGRAGSARTEVAGELGENTRQAMRRYRRGSLLLLLPFVIPTLAVLQERAESRKSSPTTDR